MKAAVIGAGFSGAAHVDAVRRAPGVELVGIAASSPERSRQLADALGAPPADSVEELISAADVVHNCTPNDLHLPLGVEALEAGAHLLSEKPLGRTAGEARELAAAAAASGRHAAVCLTYRYFPAIARMRRLLAEGVVGEVVAIRAIYLQQGLLRPGPPTWRRVASRSGPSRTLADLGTHVFDLARHVTGLEAEALVASASSMLDDEDGLDDHASVLARFGGGALASFAVSQVAAGHKNDLTLAVDGTLGSLSWAQEHPDELRVSRRGGETVLEMRSPEWALGRAPGLPAGHVEGWGDATRNLVLDFYAALAEDDGAAPPSLDEGVRAAELVEHALRSSALGEWVDVSP